VGGQTPEVRVEGVDVTAKDGSARINTISFAGFSFQPTYEALGSLGNTKLEELDPAVLRSSSHHRHRPLFGHRLRRADDEKKGPIPSGSALPSRSRAHRRQAAERHSHEHSPGHAEFLLRLPGRHQGEGFKDLAALGYKDLNVSFNTGANWNEAGKELVLREVSARGQDMGSVSLKGVFGNVTKDVFGTDSAVALVASVGATAKSAELSVENTGLFDRYLAQEARSRRRPRGAAARVRRHRRGRYSALLGNTAQGKDSARPSPASSPSPGRLTWPPRPRTAPASASPTLRSSAIRRRCSTSSS
jgi:hypothetical protein